MLSIVPALAAPDASKIVNLTERYALAHQLPVALVLAIQYTESHWGTNLNHVSPKDHGLMGLRVDHDIRPEYIGREAALMDLETNIKLGTEALVYWRRFHRSRCRTVEHPWWSHYQWGNVVHDPATGLRVGRVYRRLLYLKGRRNPRAPS